MISDPITLKRIKTIHPTLRDELDCIYFEICQYVNTKHSQIRFTDVLRSSTKQAKLYAQGRTEPGKRVTWAKPGSSYHEYGLAVDIAQLLDRNKNGTFEFASWDTTFDGDKDGISDWLEVAKIFNFYGWQWGFINSRGKRYDLPHFQKTFGFKTSELKKMPRDKNNYVILPNL